MNLKYCNFETWSSNHSPEHKDRLYRELYPYNVFSRIDFTEKLIDNEQKVEFNYASYFVELQKIELQENDRYRTTFKLSTSPKSKTQGWKKRSWDERFQIVYTKNFDFITVFTKSEDSSKDYIKRFYKDNFQKITENRSIPISDLLFRTLVSTLSEDLFGIGNYYEEFKLLKEGYRDLPQHNQFHTKDRNFFSPLYSKNRKLWVCHSFNEDKAHRIAFYNGNQCDELYVIYCNPTYTRHHRCDYPNTHILSLFEFVYRNSKKLYGEFDRQIRFLQNHLNTQEEYSEESLINEINHPKTENYEILKSELMETLGIMKITPTNNIDLFHYLSAMNLINSWINQNRKKKNDSEKLFRDMFFFKTYLSDAVSEIIKNGKFGSIIYLEKKLIIIEINDFQFSFHHIPLTQYLNNYLSSKENIKIKWSGKRLQHIAPLIFRYSKEITKKASV